jgi:hypothetical protein
MKNSDENQQQHHCDGERRHTSNPEKNNGTPDNHQQSFASKYFHPTPMTSADLFSLDYIHDDLS